MWISRLVRLRCVKPSTAGASLGRSGTENTPFNRRLSSLSGHEARQRPGTTDGSRRPSELPSTSGNVRSTARFVHRERSSRLQDIEKAKTVETFQTVEVSEKMGSCLYESGEKTYNRVHKATGAYIRAFATPKGYLVSVNGPQEAVEKAVQMLRMALVRTIFPGHAREIFGDKKESVVSISQHTGSVIAYWRIGMPPHESVVVALCPSSVSRKMVSDILDHPPMKMGLSKLVVYWLRTKGPDGVRIDHILHQTGAYVRIEDAVRPWTSDHCHEALVLGSRKATEATKNLIKECDTVKKIEVSETFASYFKVIGEPWRLAILTNALVFIEPSESSGMRNIVIVGPAAGVAIAAEQVETHTKFA